MRIKTDVVIVGTGVAGMFSALKLPRDKKIVIITKEDMRSSDSFLAQGGICVLRDENDYDSYFEDTMKAGHYENRKESVDIMIRGSRDIINDLVGYGVDFKMDGDDFAYTREGAHSRPRILYHEDITGKEISEKLLQQVLKLENVTILEYTTMQDILVENDKCAGLKAVSAEGNRDRLKAMEAGNAVMDVLSGKQYPSGKLPITLPVSLQQSPDVALGNYPGRDLKVNYEEDILVGYRWYDTKKIEPLYPFGFGLSYTSFAISNVTTDKKTFDVNDTVTLKCTIKNTGKFEGAEVLQLYASQPVCSVLRPQKELKAFEKVVLKAGEQKEVSLKVNVKDLAFYDEKNANWKVEPGEFIFHLGTSSKEIVNSVSVQVK